MCANSGFLVLSPSPHSPLMNQNVSGTDALTQTAASLRDTGLSGLRSSVFGWVLATSESSCCVCVFMKQGWFPGRQASRRSFQENLALSRRGWAASQGPGTACWLFSVGRLRGLQERCGLKPHSTECGLCARGFSISGPTEQESAFYRGSPDGVHAYYSLQNSLEPYPGAALSMKAKPVFLLLAPHSREALINILLPAEAFLLWRLPTSPSFDHSLYQQFVRYLGAVKKAFSKHALKLMGLM